MPDRIPGFKGEYLWELDVAEHHLKSLADAIPEDRYCWAPVEEARTVAAVIIHIATGNLAILDMIGVPGPPELLDALEGEGAQRFIALIVRIHCLEETITAKPAVLNWLATSLAAVRQAFTNATADELDREGDFFGERTTVRRAYLRVLAHTHEHMGQLISYVRAMGLPAPWPDPMDQIRAEIADHRSGASI